MPRILIFALSALIALSPALVRAQQPLGLKFDYAAAEDFLRAAERERLDDAQLQQIMAGHGTAAMVRNTLKYMPDTPPDGYVRSLRELAQTGRITSDDYGIGLAAKHAASLKAFLAAIQRDEKAMEARIVSRLKPYWQSEVPVEIRVYLVVGGASDGFVVDGDPSPAFYIAVDKAGGDIAGLEQNISHESVHVLQRQLGLRHCPARTPIDKQTPMERFRTIVYEEGVANYLADPKQITGEGEYIAMWRNRYQRNETLERMRENFWLHDVLLDGLRKGTLSWETAYQIGFMGNLDARMYFVGREFARRHAAVGRAPLSVEFVCRPETFFAR